MLEITGLAVKASIGVYPWEKQIKQSLLIDIQLFLDSSNTQDMLENSIDYEACCKQVSHFLQSKHFNLIETAANETAQFIKDTFQVQKLTLAVSKPNAIKEANNIKIIIER